MSMISACCCGKKGQCCGVEPSEEAGVGLPTNIEVGYTFIGAPAAGYCKTDTPNPTALWRFDSCWGTRPRSEGNDCHDYDPLYVRAAPIGDAAGINNQGWYRVFGASDPLFFNVVRGGYVQNGSVGYNCNPAGTGPYPCHCSNAPYGYPSCTGSCSTESLNICAGCTQVFNSSPVAGCKSYVCGSCGCDPNSCANYDYLAPTETYCGRILASEYTYERWLEAAFVGWCQSQRVNIALDPCVTQLSSGCVMLEQRAAWNGTDYVAPSTTAANGTVHTPETPKVVARMNRTATDAVVDWNANIVITIADCAGPLIAEGGIRSSRQYGEATVAAPLTAAEYNLLNGTCDGVCTSGEFGSCKAQCAKCQQASVTLSIIERGPRMDASDMVVGEEYEILQQNGFPFHCHGAGASPAVGQLFVAVSCVQPPAPAPQNCACPTSINARGTGSFVLPVKRHTFTVQGRGHIGDLLSHMAGRFADGSWEYYWDTTDQTQRGYSMSGYTVSIIDSDSWVGGSEIASNCCDEPQYITPYINAWEYGCTGCIENLYQHWVKASTVQQADIYSIPNRYYAALTDCAKTIRCGTFSATHPAYWHSTGCCPVTSTEVIPAQSISGCILNDCELGGSQTWTAAGRTVWAAAKRGRTGAGFGAAWGSITQGRGIYTNDDDIEFSFTTS